MTAVQIHRDETQAIGRPAVALPIDHADINFGDLLSLCKELVGTGFMPQHIKTPGQAAAIILTGRELGMGPLRAIRSLQMVKGKVIESADSQLARFKTDGGRAVFGELTDKVATLTLRHPNGDEHTESFSIEDAKRAGLTGDNWKNYPKAMLRSRVITAGLKSVGWEGSAGNYDRDEAVTSFAPELEAQPANAGRKKEAEADTGEAPSDAQRTKFADLMGSPLFSEDERERGLEKAGRVTKQKMGAMIANAMAELLRRQAAKDAAAAEAGEVEAGDAREEDDLP